MTQAHFPGLPLAIADLAPCLLLTPIGHRSYRNVISSKTNSNGHCKGDKGIEQDERTSHGIRHPRPVKLTRGGERPPANQPYPLARFPSISKPNCWCRGSTETTPRAPSPPATHTSVCPAALTLLGSKVRSLGEYTIHICV